MPQHVARAFSYLEMCLGDTQRLSNQQLPHMDMDTVAVHALTNTKWRQATRAVEQFLQAGSTLRTGAVAAASQGAQGPPPTSKDSIVDKNLFEPVRKAACI